MPKQYDDFDLIFQTAEGGYVVQLLNSPAGQAAGEFKLPFTQGELRDFYSRIGQRNRSMRRVDSPDVAAAKKFGGLLFRSTFQGELLGRLRASTDRSRASGRGLRLRLRLKGAPELAELPWEFLYDIDQDHFLATSRTTPVVRYLDLAEGVSALRVRLPLNILVVIAGPRNLHALDSEGEWERLRSSLATLESTGVISLERLPAATLDALRRRARGLPFHILHFVGHGSFDDVARDGVLYLEDSKGMSDPIQGHILGNILRDHDSLRLAVLNACEGARQSNEDPFSGVAQTLCQQRLPAVIAMQFEISDDAAKTFAEEFYAAIADCLPVDAAVAESRKALFTGRFGQEWATPVLYMRSPDGLLFDIQRKAKSVDRAPEKGPPDEQKEQLRLQQQAEEEARQKEERDRREREALEQEGEQRRLQQQEERWAARREREALEHPRPQQRAEETSLSDERERLERESSAKHPSPDLYGYSNEPRVSGTPISAIPPRVLTPKTQETKKKLYLIVAIISVATLLVIIALNRKSKDIPSSVSNSAAVPSSRDDGSSAYRTGLNYLTGSGVPQDYAQAKQWFEKAAAAGNADAMTNLGHQYDFGYGVPKDYAQAKQWYEKAAAGGNATAMDDLGRLYANGYGVPKDYGQAKQWYEKAVAAGNALAMDNLGLLYERGNGVPRDYAQAKQWYEKAAAGGKATAMYHLGLLYESGNGVPQDYAQAKQWYEKAAAGGNADAMDYLGFLYNYGDYRIGVPQDYAQAKRWYERAAAAGNADAMDNLGSLYANGNGVAQDYAQAKQWFEKAAAGGNAHAMDNLGLLYEYERANGVAQDYAQAKQWYEKAAAGGSADAMYHLGHLYENGNGVPKDDTQAKQWYEKAAAAGDPDATKRLAKYKHSGKG